MKVQMSRFEASKQKTIVIVGIVFLLLIGLLYDASNGFYVLKHSRSMYGMAFGLSLTAFFAGLGESLSNYIEAKDKVSHPLPKRVFYLLLLLAALAAVGFLYWFACTYSGIVEI
ncbi:hypothetical protein FO488_04890 [Geobacter sp. FeAm09]|uniref:hypothetical protein n=1 Tax=Geobacter sp. FeAm09 TaxID=2597769 RepID=UPI0011EEB9BA|nr:hypothetical protein [Geobacter sp. FeAm09]QEM67549.1 hypothetical protein FO488_04890 [Geobacter sp. FeAm09]